MDKIIIGLHGLANKPEEDVLKDWWYKSIQEGLDKNCKIPNTQFDFKMIYWADYLYTARQHNDVNYDFDGLFNDEPYVEAKPDALNEYKTTIRDRLKIGALDFAGTALDKIKGDFKRLNDFEDWVLSKIVKDLHFYYDDKRQIYNKKLDKKGLARQVLRDEVSATLKDAKGKKIMLIAHSMGSIIAYDTLRDMGKDDSDFKVSDFVTIGSPLGLPHVKHKIIKERGYDPDVRTPSCVTGSWINYADKDDKIAIDSHLADDFGPNRHKVECKDDLVANDYVAPYGEKKANKHKSYGYLRTPELSRHISKFLELK